MYSKSEVEVEKESDTLSFTNIFINEYIFNDII